MPISTTWSLFRRAFEKSRKMQTWSIISLGQISFKPMVPRTKTTTHRTTCLRRHTNRTAAVTMTHHHRFNHLSFFESQGLLLVCHHNGTLDDALRWVTTLGYVLEYFSQRSGDSSDFIPRRHKITRKSTLDLIQTKIRLIMLCKHGGTFLKIHTISHYTR